MLLRKIKGGGGVGVHTCTCTSMSGILCFGDKISECQDFFFLLRSTVFSLDQVLVTGKCTVSLLSLSLRNQMYYIEVR